MTGKKRRFLIIFTFVLIFLVISMHHISQEYEYPYITGKDSKCFISPSSSSCGEQGSFRRTFDNVTGMSSRDAEEIAKIWEHELSQSQQVTQHGNSRSMLDGTIEGGGEPERIMLVSTFRSGSSYVGSILRSRPAVYYFFEPLQNSFHLSVVRTEGNVQKALEFIRNLFQCRDEDGQHINKLNGRKGFFSRDSKMYEITKGNKAQRDPTFVTAMCRRSPVLAMKTVRLKLRHASTLLGDEKLNLKMIYLVRDPRATMNSRLNTRWSPPIPDCGNFSLLCSDIAEDFTVAKDLEKEYPNRFMVLQYEDLLTGSRTSNQLSHFLNMSSDAFTTLTAAQRESQRTKWVKELGLNSHLIQSIQDACVTAMDLWGYEPIKVRSLPSKRP